MNSLRAFLAVAVLVLLGAAAASEPNRPHETVDVTIRHSRFVPAQFEFRAGTTVTFVIHNTDPIDHEFILGDASVQDRHEGGKEPAHGQVPGEVSVPSGSTGRTTFTFTSPGILLIGCHFPGHYDYGMKGTVLVR
jgi:uncharacterized cupredoxin-like copper-binding protein